MAETQAKGSLGGARPTWKSLVERKAPLLLPAAHDALTARLIERAGFDAYQVGGFALNGARHAYPDLDLTHFDEERTGVRDIMEASTLPVLVDADDGYGDAKNVTRTIRGYEAIGASALFFEDQHAPKRCGHLAGKSVVPPEVMEAKVRAAVAARSSPDFYLVARTDAIEAHGVDDALRRAERYLKAGADAIFVEGPRSVEEIEQIARGLKGASLVVNMFEGGGRTPWLSPKDLHALGFAMILFPTTLLFRVTRALERALADLKAGRPMPPEEGVDLKKYEEIVGLADWEEIEKRFQPEESS
jgi:2-methylisocitrate lyase-like PEP mutase family enzyme